MNCSLDYSKDRNFLIGTITGIATAESLEAMVLQVTNSETIPSDTDTIWDMTGLDFTLIGHELLQGFARIRGGDLDAERGNCKVAIIVPNQGAETLMKIWSAYSAEHRTNLRIYLTMAEAEAWVKG